MFADILVAADLVARTGGQKRAAFDDIGAVTDIKRLADVVVGDQHADVVLDQLVDDLLDIADRQRVDPGKRLIEQQKTRRIDQRAGDLGTAAFSPREGDSLAIADRFDIEHIQQLFNPFILRFFIFDIDLGRDHQVLFHRQVFEDRRLLRQVADPFDRALVQRHMGDILAVEKDLAACHLDKPADHVKTGRLPRAVWTEKADDLARIDLKRHAADDLCPLYRLDKIFGY